MIKLRTGMTVLLSTCFFYACDSAPVQTETIPPVINLYNPDSNGLIINGDTLAFTGNLTDEGKLHSMLLTIEGLQGQIYYTYNPTVDGLTTYSFNTPWLVYGIPYDTIGYLNLQVTDQSGNYASKHWYMRLRN
jgi:hypothetical protein